MEPRVVPIAASVGEDPRSSMGESVHSNLSLLSNNLSITKLYSSTRPLPLRWMANDVASTDGGRSNGNKGGGRAMTARAMATTTVMATMWATETTTRLVGDIMSNGDGGKGNGNGNEGGGQRRVQGRQG